MFCFYVLFLCFIFRYFLFFDKTFNIASVNNLKTLHRYGPLTILIPVVSIIILSLFQHHHKKSINMLFQLTIHNTLECR